MGCAWGEVCVREVWASLHLGDDQKMSWCDWVDVFECEAFGVLEDHLAWDRLGKDAVKDGGRRLVPGAYAPPMGRG